MALGIILSHAVHAEETEPSPYKFLDRPHDRISTGVEALSKRIDAYFTGTRIYDETTGSYLRITGSTVFEQGGDVGYHTDLKLKVRLPRTKKKLRLLIESDTEEDLEKGRIITGQGTPKEAVRDSSYFAAIRRQGRKTDNWDINTDLGLKLHNPLDPFTRLKIRYSDTKGPWERRFSNTFYWFNTKGGGVDNGLDLDKKLARGILFRSATGLGWSDPKDFFEMSQHFFIFHELNDRQALVWQAGVYGESQPTIHAETYVLGLRFRQRLHRNWLFFEVKPEVYFKKEDAFSPAPFLTLSLEMVMGEDYL